jgi:hypothetical protein
VLGDWFPVAARPAAGFAYLPTCLRTNRLVEGAWIHAELQAIPRKRVLHTKQANLAIPLDPDSLFLGIFHQPRHQP